MILSAFGDVALLVTVAGSRREMATRNAREDRKEGCEPDHGGEDPASHSDCSAEQLQFTFQWAQHNNMQPPSKKWNGISANLFQLDNRF
jgi:hypothetical protein